ncbi:MAG: tRNA lysidine(34) synthetase TilS [Deltaproteobacteria bacterium]|nr:tRNA lysidine(34) synthetase TilS [Deltaproteobacteria bacterium]
MVERFLSNIQRTIERYRMVQPEDKVLIAVSGGPDSMALLTALKQLQNCLKISLSAAYYNHRLRGEESETEAEFVRAEVEKSGVPLIAEDDDGGLLAHQSNVEEAARKKRHAFFRRAALETGAQKIALGHTADDQAETFFLWLFRGAGMRGLAGIPPVRDDLFIRPLIETWRAEILKFLGSENIPWIEDSSNLMTRYLRNRIRHSLLPKLSRELGDRFSENILKMTHILRDDDTFLEEVSYKHYQQLRNVDRGEGVVLSVSGVSELPTALQRRVIRHAIREVNGSLKRINFAHAAAIMAMIKSDAPNQRVSLPDGLVAAKEYDRLLIGTLYIRKVNFRYEYMSLPKEMILTEIDRKIAVELLDRGKDGLPAGESSAALIDFDALRFPVIVRNWMEGDRFQPLGMKGMKKVKDFFIDRKLPLRERGRVPIVLFGDRIVWIGGQRIDDRVKVTEGTRMVIRLRLV